MSKDHLAVGNLLHGRYQISSRLATGVVGQTYLAQDQKFSDAPRMIRQIPFESENEAQYQELVKNFQQKAQTLSLLSHPGLATLYDYFVEGNCYFLVLKNCEGKTLQDLMRAAENERLAEADVTKWARQICDVYCYIHALNPPMLHCDLKAELVLLNEQKDQITLLEFGVNQFAVEVNTAVGTPSYEAPEFFLNKAAPQSDIYSLGVLIYHLLTGVFQRANPLTGIDLSGRNRPITANPELTPEIDEIICRAAASKIENRYQSAVEMKKALEEHLQELAGEPAATTAEHKVEVTSFDAAAPESLKAALKIVFCNKDITATFPLNKRAIMIGRSDVDNDFKPDIDLTAYDTSGKISRRHAVVTFISGRFRFEDLGSSNGSLYNGEVTKPEQTIVMEAGDQIMIGETVLEFMLL